MVANDLHYNLHLVHLHNLHLHLVQILTSGGHTAIENKFVNRGEPGLLSTFHFEVRVFDMDSTGDLDDMGDGI